ncbi:DUF4259 domain-containing protein [Streptomyces sp. MK7]|uniref:DUF4259 domain-containing protein n=1 Tax=Streptomyces sp. MK7 TaxID=3067635 RepID=UPI00292EE48C|nr:DUF4259 domain-containing protein [Streptomyces sp. MK7]
MFSAAFPGELWRDGRDTATWDIGPFDNDTAADFGGDLDEAALEEREALIRSALKRAADPADFLDTSETASEQWPRPQWSLLSALMAN